VPAFLGGTSPYVYDAAHVAGYSTVVGGSLQGLDAALRAAPWGCLE